MNIQGLIKTTLLDYPGIVASTIFLGGCNMRCPFCHNMNLVNNIEEAPYSESDIFTHLNKRQGIIEGVCITGGEPTLHKDLPVFISRIRQLDYKIKLDTNGTNPQMLAELISNGLIDYVAMDIKSSPANYAIVCGNSAIDFSSIEKSIKILINSNIDYEFRTTLVSQYHNFEVIKDIATLINGAKKYYLQSFKDSQYVPDHSLSPCGEDILKTYKDYLASYIEKVEIRGI